VTVWRFMVRVRWMKCSHGDRGTGRSGGREKTNKGTDEQREIMDGYKAAPCSRLLRLDRIGFSRMFCKRVHFRQGQTVPSVCAGSPLVRSNS
jgi:hypothetical protein